MLVAVITCNTKTMYMRKFLTCIYFYQPLSHCICQLILQNKLLGTNKKAFIVTIIVQCFRLRRVYNNVISIINND